MVNHKKSLIKPDKKKELRAKVMRLKVRDYVLEKEFKLSLINTKNVSE